MSLQTFAQNRTVSGKVTAQEDNSSLPGVNVIVKGTTSGTVTDANGAYSISVPGNNAILVFSFIGYTTEETAVGNRNTIDLAMVSDIKALQEVVVTGYGTQDKKDITGAVAVIKPKDLLSVASSSFTQQLEGRAPGVFVTSSGEAGGAVSVRIRGVGTFGNNDPLYVIDGVPTQGAYQNAINPNDIESLQVLKDAAAASIYGSRASGGVVIITTKKGKSGPTKVSYNTYYGVQTLAKKLDLLNPTEYADLIWQSYQNFGLTPPADQYGTGATPRLPDYIFPAGAMEGDPRVDPANYSTNIDDPAFGNSKWLITRANKEGTDWFEEVFKPARIMEHNLNLSGGAEKNRFNVSFNYFDQPGLMRYTNYKRYSARANSSFDFKNNFTVGENLMVSYVESVGQPSGNQSEGNPISNIWKVQSILPVYDIGGNFAGSKGSGLGNGSNPLAQLYRNKDNKGRYVRLFGNVFAEARFLKNFTARTSFGVDYNFGYTYGFNYRNFEHSEPGSSNGFNENANYNVGWTWTNTLTFDRNINDIHLIKAYIGYEAILNSGRGLGGSRVNYFTDNRNFWTLTAGNPQGQQNSSYSYGNALASAFARVDYSLLDKYLFSATIRRDGSSRFGDQKYANFPAASIGWRISNEAFMDAVPLITDLKVRLGWGITGNQAIRDFNAYSTFSAGGRPAFSAYDITGSSTSAVTGFAPNSIGNRQTKWESGVSTNAGLDVSLLDGMVDVTFDVYERVTKDLLYQQNLPAPAGQAAAPFVNIGEMKNTGFDLGVNYRNTIGDFRYDIGANLSHYKNQIVRVGDNEKDFFTGGGSRFGDITRSEKGSSISQFYGYQIVGIFQNEEQVNAAPEQPGGNKVGRWQFADINGDNIVNADDKTFIGNPHPKLLYGLNISLGYKNFDLTMFLQGSYGNDIYNYNRWFTDFFSFAGNKSKDMLYNSWRPDRPNAKLPILDANDNVSPSFSHSYYIEKGSYFRGKNFQLGYTLPKDLLTRIGVDNTRIYLQAQNLFTITKYTGLDPALSRQNPADANNSERTIGVDFGNFPLPRIFMAGLNIGF